ncbi:MAG: hypothetical protein HY397_01005 [Candidatus Doudnabacteria bacterium]|nr:hypothetical protein [Candidatus Doudnabacteria bacterium]
MLLHWVEVTGELVESWEKGALLYYGTVRLAVAERKLERTYNLAASTVLGVFSINLNVTENAQEILSMADFSNPTPFQTALFALFGQLLCDISARGSQPKHLIQARLALEDSAAFEVLCQGLSQKPN